MLTAVIRLFSVRGLLGHRDEPGCHLALITAIEVPNHKLLINYELVGSRELRTSQFAKFATTDSRSRILPIAVGSESSASIGLGEENSKNTPSGTKDSPERIDSAYDRTSKRDVYSNNAYVTKDSDAWFGSWRTKTVFPGLDSSRIRQPPCARAASCAIVSPSPTPPFFSTLING
jgi:hypothetical protein